jgi:hypothetical protein
MSRILWTLKRHAGPRPRALHAVTFDAAHQRTLLFGGVATGTRLGDTWTWDGDNWTQVNDIGPLPRSEAALAWDVARQRAILFGGFDGTGVRGDTWEWDGTDWTQVAESGPDARLGHGLVFDSQRSRVVLFGGEDFGGGRRFDDTWEWDGDEWVQTADAGPTPRRGHAMAFDSVRARIVLFGGLDASNTTLADTWEWDGTVWTQVASFGPPATLLGTMVYTGRRALLFGGTTALDNAAELFHISWEWDGRHWTMRQDMGPSARWGHAMVFDPVRKRSVLFGGSTVAFGAAERAESGETWEQFEVGAAPPPPPPPIDPYSYLRIIDVAVLPSQPSETDALMFEATLSQTLDGKYDAFVTFQVDMLLHPAGELRYIREIEVYAGPELNPEQKVFLPTRHVLAAGRYKVSAWLLDGARRDATFEVAQSAVQIASLAATPGSLPRGTALVLTATLAAPAPPSGIYVPLFVSSPTVDALPVPDLLLNVPADAVTGSITIPESRLQPESSQLTFTASLGGVTASTTVTFV